MPHMSGTGMLLMGLLCLIGFTLYSILLVIPCWIIAKRRNVAARWWNWVIPLWNFYIAYRLGSGSIPKAILIIVFGIAGSVAVALNYSPMYLAAGSAALIIALGVFCYVLYSWLLQISILAGVHPHFLPMVMFVIPVLLAIAGFTLVITEMAPMPYVNIFENVISIISWIIFFVVALRTSREELSEPEFILGKE